MRPTRCPTRGTALLACAWLVFVGLGIALAAPTRADEVFATVEKTAAPGERARVHVQADQAGPALLLAYRVEDPRALLDAGLDLRDGPAIVDRLASSLDAARAAAGDRVPALPGPSSGRAVPRKSARDSSRPSAIDARLTFVASKSVTLEVPKPSGAPAEKNASPPLAGAEVEVPLPASGLYLIEVRHGKASTVVASLVSRLALVTKRDPSSLVAFLVDRTSGTPIEGGTIEVRAGAATVTSAKTDASGLARLAVSNAPTAFVRAISGDDLAFGTETYFPAGVSDRRVYAFPHQPAYRPGERVECKGIVRAFRDGRYELDGDVREVDVRFVAAGGREIGRARASLSPDLGTFAAGVDVPKDAPTGDASIVVEIGRDSYAAPFRIEEYRKPTFEVAVRANPARVLSGADVAFEVEGSFFEGGPLANAPLKWTLLYHRVDRDLFPTDELARLFFGTEREAYAPETIGEGAASLDAAGRTTVKAKAPLKDADGFLTLRVVVTGPDRMSAAGSGGAALSAAPVSVALKTDKHLYGAEGVARVTVRALAADGSPAAGRKGVLVSALVTERIESGKRVRREEEQSSLAIETGADGSTSLDVPFSRNGRYAISVALPRVAGEPAGPPAHAVLDVWVAGDRADVGYSGDRLEVIADKDAYAVGDVARLLVLSPVGARPFLSTLEGVRIFDARTRPLVGTEESGCASVVEVPITADHVPNVYLGVALVDHGHRLSTEKMIRVPPVDRVLVPTVRPEKTELEPGETIGMTASVADGAGKPVANAEVSVAVVDDALYALYSDPAAPIVPFFHPVRRNDVRTGGPLDLESVGWDRSVEPEGKKDRASTGAAAGAEGGLAAPGSPPPPAPSPTSPSSPSRPGAPAEAEAPRSLGALRERARDDDGGSGAPKKEKSDRGEGPLEARSDFRSSISWTPTLRTGTDGTVSLGNVRFADSLTRWRITAVAVDASTRVGASTSTVRTAKNVLTRVTLPRFLRATDTVHAPWILHSMLPSDTEASFVAGATGLVLEGAHAGKELLKAGAVSVRDLKLTAPSVGEGKVTAEVRTSAGSDAVATTIPVLPQGIPKTLIVSAVAEGKPTTLAPLTLPPTAEKGTARLRIAVAPSVAQAIGAALPYLADYPYGCTEQTMSRLVPVIVAHGALDRLHIPLKGRLEELPKMLQAGIARLQVLQHADGGFGWWPEDTSDPYMTAYVLHGLVPALDLMRHSPPVSEMLSRASRWCKAWLSTSSESRDFTTWAFVRMVFAEEEPRSSVLPAARFSNTDMPDLARAFLLRAVAMSAISKSDEDVVRHAEVLWKHAVRDAAGVHFAGSGGPDGTWTQDPVETTAWVLGSLLQADPDHPDLAAGVRWLLAQRRGVDHWKSTRDTAACVAFLTRYVAVTKDLGAGRSVALTVNGRALPSVVITPENAFTDAAVVEVPLDGNPPGPITVVATPASGSATISASLSFTEIGPAITASSAGFEVSRTWWILPSTQDVAQPLPRRPVTESVPSGSVIDVEITVTTPVDREFVLVTSPYAAGFEPEKTFDAPSRASGSPAEHVETRDDRTAFFVKRLPAGTHVFRHRVRATHVGSFTALPAQAELMYFPDVRGNGAGEVLEVSAEGKAAFVEGGK